MEKLNATFLLSFLLFTTPILTAPVQAHGPGGHTAQKPISSEKALDLASIKVIELAKAGVIDKSWESAGSSEIEKKTYGPRKEWLITFKNDKVSDASKQTLYLFYSLGGQYIAANYTGK